MDVSEQPGITVVIPAYNYAQFIADAVDSSLAQDYPRVEVLVVNDGSTDNTDEICKRYGDKITYVYKENAGLSAARNTGIERARYDYIAFMDADDAYEPGALTKLMGKMQELGDAFVLISAYALQIYADGSYITTFRKRPAGEGEITSADLYIRSRFSPSSVLIRKSVFAKVGDFDTSLRSSEDRDMWIRAATCGRCYQIYDEIIKVRRHGSNMSGNTQRMLESKRKVMQKGVDLKIVQKGGALERKALAYHWHDSAQLHRSDKQYFKAVWHMLVSIFYWPYFTQPEKLAQVRFFRLRALAAFLKPRLSPQVAMEKRQRENARSQ